MSADVRPIPWSHLTPRDQERLTLMVGSFEEFEAGVQLGSIAPEGVTPVNHAARRFFSNAVYHYLDSYYTGSGSHGVLPVLDSIGWREMADLFRSVLATSVGDSTVGETLRGLRNKGISHLSFRAEHLVKELRPAALHSSDNATTFMEHMVFLVSATRDLRNTEPVNDFETVAS